jgi:hypothetical protein
MATKLELYTTPDSATNVRVVNLPNCTPPECNTSSEVRDIILFEILQQLKLANALHVRELTCRARNVVGGMSEHDINTLVAAFDFSKKI